MAKKRPTAEPAEPVLHQKISWYVTLEEIIGIPLIGMNLDAFMAAIEGNDYISASLGNYSRLHLSIESEHTRRHNNIEGAGVNISILPDGSLRPNEINNYNRLFGYDPTVNLNRGVRIHPIGRAKTWYRGNGWPEAETETMVVTRHVNGGYLGSKHERGQSEVYNRDGRRMSTRTYVPDYSRELC